jgi:DNA-binding NarL/FixJ family response regulator
MRTSAASDPRVDSAPSEQSNLMKGGVVSRPLRRSKKRISVLIITADEMTSELLKTAFAYGRTNFSVKSLTGSSEKIIACLGAHKAHVALISEELLDGPNAGFKVLQKIEPSRGTFPIMLLQSSRRECVVNAFRDGARGIFYRNHSLKSLAKCIQVVSEGQIWANNMDFEHLVSVITNLRPFRINNALGIPILTRREEEVVRLVSDGLKNREIAQELNVQEHSIRNYLYRIFEKVGVSTRVELILYASSQRERSKYMTAVGSS